MTRVIVCTFIALLVGLGASPAAAQQPTDAEINEYIELVRMDVRQGRADLIGQHMALSAGQAAQFWPIYESYEMSYTELGDEELKLIMDYARSYDSMTDDAAGQLATRALDIEQQELDLLRDYYGKVESALGGAVAARFMQVERRIKTLLDLQLAADIPLLEAP